MNMKKKVYVIPSLEVVEMECVSVLANSPTFDTDEKEENDPNDQTKKHDGPFKHIWE